MATTRVSLENLQKSVNTYAQKISGNGGGITSGLEYKVETLIKEVEDLCVQVAHRESTIEPFIEWVKGCMSSTKKCQLRQSLELVKPPARDEIVFGKFKFRGKITAGVLAIIGLLALVGAFGYALYKGWIVVP